MYFVSVQVSIPSAATDDYPETGVQLSMSVGITFEVGAVVGASTLTWWEYFILVDNGTYRVFPRTYISLQKSTKFKMNLI